MGPTVLVVDDDRRYRDLLELNLARRGYRPLIASDGLAALNLLEREPVDLVTLDLMLPDIDGYELCRRIREYSDVPIIMLTAKADDGYKVRGLNIGADDYVTKPFSPDELLARIEAVLRRHGATAAAIARPPLVSGQLVVDFARHRVTLRGREVHLTPHEYKLLYHLAVNAGRVLVHDEILRRVWGVGYQDQTDLLQTTVRRLRHKIEDDPSAPRYLLTRRGIGYLLTTPTAG
ncbi:MAG TPA: response regulator transcription factor [Chloroflexota bacterium]|jgi:DNA-binding response OmpR family regulator